MSKIPDVLRACKIIITKPSDGSDPFPFAPTTPRERLLGRTRSTIGRPLPNTKEEEYRIASHSSLLADQDLPISREVYVPVRQAFFDTRGYGDVSERQIVDDERAQHELHMSRLDATRRLKREREQILDEENARIAEKRDQYMRITALAERLKREQATAQLLRDKVEFDAIQTALDAEYAMERAKAAVMRAEECATRAMEEESTCAKSVESERAILQKAEDEQRQKEKKAQLISQEAQRSRLAEEDRLSQRKREEAMRDAEEAERVAEEKKRIANEKEAKRIAEEEEAKLTSEEKEAKRVAKEEEKMRNLIRDIDYTKTSVEEILSSLNTQLQKITKSQKVFVDDNNNPDEIREAVEQVLSRFKLAQSDTQELVKAIEQITETSLLAKVDNAKFISDSRATGEQTMEKITVIAGQASEKLNEITSKERQVQLDALNDQLQTLFALLTRNLTIVTDAKKTYDTLSTKNTSNLQSYRQTVEDQYGLAVGTQNKILELLGKISAYEDLNEFVTRRQASATAANSTVGKITTIFNNIPREVEGGASGGGSGENEDDDGESNGDGFGMRMGSSYNLRDRRKV